MVDYDIFRCKGTLYQQCIYEVYKLVQSKHSTYFNNQTIEENRNIIENNCAFIDMLKSTSCADVYRNHGIYNIGDKRLKNIKMFYHHVCNQVMANLRDTPEARICLVLVSIVKIPL